VYAQFYSMWHGHSRDSLSAVQCMHTDGHNPDTHQPVDAVARERVHVSRRDLVDPWRHNPRRKHCVLDDPGAAHGDGVGVVKAPRIARLVSAHGCPEMIDKRCRRHVM